MHIVKSLLLFFERRERETEKTGRDVRVNINRNKKEKKESAVWEKRITLPHLLKNSTRLWLKKEPVVKAEGMIVAAIAREETFCSPNDSWPWARSQPDA